MAFMITEETKLTEKTKNLQRRDWRIDTSHRRSPYRRCPGDLPSGSDQTSLRRDISDQGRLACEHRVENSLRI